MPARVAPSDAAQCPTRRIMDIIGAKWTLAILPLLREKPLRNGQLLRVIPGLSQRVLTQTLRHLERDGLVLRTDHHQKPLHVDYALTPLGLSLADAFSTLNDWVIEHYPQIESSRNTSAKSGSKSRDEWKPN